MKILWVCRPNRTRRGNREKIAYAEMKVLTLPYPTQIKPESLGSIPRSNIRLVAGHRQISDRHPKVRPTGNPGPEPSCETTRNSHKKSDGACKPRSSGASGSLPPTRCFLGRAIEHELQAQWLLHSVHSRGPLFDGTERFGRALLVRQAASSFRPVVGVIGDTARHPVTRIVGDNGFY